MRTSSSDAALERTNQNACKVGERRDAPREAFVAAELREFPLRGQPLPIEQGQTISQPYIVALRIASEVYTIERHKALAETAQRRFAELGYGNIEVRHGDGTIGGPEPFGL